MTFHSPLFPIERFLKWAARPRVFRTLSALGCGFLVTLICSWMALTEMSLRYESDAFLIRKYAALTVQSANSFRAHHHRFPRDVQEMLDDTSLSIGQLSRQYRLEVAENAVHAIYLHREGAFWGPALNCDIREDTTDFAACSPGPSVLWQDPRAANMVSCGIISGLITALLAFASIKPPELTRRSCMTSAIGFTFLVVGAGYVAAIITALHYPSGH